MPKENIIDGARLNETEASILGFTWVDDLNGKKEICSVTRYLSE